jgi:hypothetical protein
VEQLAILIALYAYSELTEYILPASVIDPHPPNSKLGSSCTPRRQHDSRHGAAGCAGTGRTVHCDFAAGEHPRASPSEAIANSVGARVGEQCTTRQRRGEHGVARGGSERPAGDVAGESARSRTARPTSRKGDGGGCNCFALLRRRALLPAVVLTDVSDDAVSSQVSQLTAWHAALPMQSAFCPVREVAALRDARRARLTGGGKGGVELRQGEGKHGRRQQRRLQQPAPRAG